MDENERTSDQGEQSGAGASARPEQAGAQAEPTPPAQTNPAGATLPLNQPDPQPAGPPPDGSADPVAQPQPTAAPQPAPRRRVRVPATTRTWVAAVIGLVLLLGGGLGGYFIGAANDHDVRDGRPGLSRDHRPGFGPQFRDGPPAPPFRDGRGGR